MPIAWNDGVCPTACGSVPGEQGQCACTITPYGDEVPGPLTCHGYRTTSPVEAQHGSPFSVHGRWSIYGDPGDLDDPNPIGLAADLQGQRVLGPGESAILDLTPQTTDSCAGGAGQVFYPGIFGGEVSRRITVLGSD